jgi:hypothetical protein
LVASVARAGQRASMATFAVTEFVPMSLVVTFAMAFAVT